MNHDETADPSALPLFPARVRVLARRYPLSIPGSVLSVVSLYLFFDGLVKENPYALAIAILGILIVGVLLGIGYAQKKRISRGIPEWDSSFPLQARTEGRCRFATAMPMVLPPFFRLNAVISGLMKCGRRASLLIRQEASSTESQVDVPMRFPLSGVMDASAVLAIRDTFGLIRIIIAPPVRRRLHVRPAPASDINLPFFMAKEGQETRTHRQESDIERYFMREYIPGDRYRDINWKASSKTRELFTRISPKTQDESHIVTVAYRPYTPDGLETRESIAHLDFLRTWFLLFLRFIKQEQSDAEFRIFSGEMEYHLVNPEDIERFAQTISELAYGSPGPALPADLAAVQDGTVFIFTTPYDPNISTLLNALSGRSVFLFRTARADGAAERVRRIALFRYSDSVLLPGAWTLKADSKETGSAGGTHEGIRTFTETLEVHLS